MIDFLLQQFGTSPETDLGNHWIVGLIELSLLGAVVVSVSVVIERVLRRKVSNRFLYMMWMLILLRFVLIWTPESPTSFLNSIRIASEPALTIDVPEVRETPTPLIALTPQTIPLQESDFATSGPSLPNVQLTQDRETNWIHILAFVWSIGCVLLTTRLFVGWLNLRRTLLLADESSVVAPSIDKLCCELRRKFGIQSKVRVLISNRIATPATAGIFRPVILMPTRCVAELHKDELCLVLTHELVHIKRNDGFIQLVAWAIQTLHWFNPFVHIAVRKIADHRELSCDSAVLGSLNEPLKRLYGQTILKLAEFESATDQFPPALAHGFIGSNNKLITQRIDMIMNPKSKRWIGTFWGAFLMVAVLAIGYTTAQTQQPIAKEANGSPVQPEHSATGETSEPDSNSADSEKTFTRNAKWPKPFRVASNPNHLEHPSTYPDLSTGQWPDELPPEHALASPFMSPEDDETPNHVTGATEQWSVVRDKAIAKHTTYSRPFLPDETPKPSEVTRPSRVPINLKAGTDRRFKFDKQIPELMVSRPELAELVPLAPTEVLFKGNEPGVCNADIKFEDGSTEAVVIRVCYDTEKLEETLKTYFPDSKVRVDSTPHRITLHCDENGSRSAKQMIQVAEDITGAKVYAEYSRKPQMSFKIQVCKISIDKFNNVAASPEGGNLKILSPFFPTEDQRSNKYEHTEIFYQIDTKSQKAMLELIQCKAATLINEPTIVSAFGQQAEFFSGTEIMLRLPNGEFETRQIGNSLLLTAVKGENENLTLEMKAQFSAIAPWLSSGDGTPGFSVNRINTGIKTKFGHTAMLLGPKSKTPESQRTIILVTPNRLPKP